MKADRITGYLAPEGFTQELTDELSRTSEVIAVHDRLILVQGAAVAAAWAQNIWFEPVRIPIESISQGAKALRSLQRNWACYSFQNHRRAQLIQAQLPKVTSPLLEFLQAPPAAPLGSWTLLEPNLLLASPNCASPFPHGDVRFKENHTAPPSRAYLKLWELFSVHNQRPQKGEVCLDLGSSPGGWTWVLQQLGCQVLSVDKADLSPKVANLPGVRFVRQSAFGLRPQDIGRVDWLFSDIICYPTRLYQLVESWLASGLCRNFVCTIKFKGGTDHETTRKFAAIPGSRLLHLSHNKHELTWVRTEPS